jgi:integrase
MKRGDGQIYKRGSVYWIDYWARGERHRESAHTDNEDQARKLLRKRMAEVIHTGKALSATEGKVTFEECAAALETDYAVNGKRSVRSVKLSIRHLQGYFQGARALDITTDRVKRYVAIRQGEGAENASINRELSALKRMLRLMLQGGRLSSVPYIPMLEEHNARQGFVEPADFRALHTELPDYLQGPVLFLYLSGWRLGEMKSLQWRDVDLPGQAIHLRPEHSKSKRGRVLPLRGELLGIFEQALDRRSLACPYVFHDDNGWPIGDFRKAWRTAGRASGVHVLVHDLRRSAVRNMIRAGIAEHTAMAISGHRTRSVFDRYDIVSLTDLERSVEQVQEYIARPATRTVVTLPTVTDGREPSQKRHNDSPAESSITEKVLDSEGFSGATRRIRTDDLLITNQLLYRLS